MKKYLGSIFAYDYEIYDRADKKRDIEKPPSPCRGIAGVKSGDPLIAFVKEWVYFLGFLVLVPFAAKIYRQN